MSTPEGLPDNETLTPEQSEFADFLIDTCELKEVADQPVIMHGYSGTVRYGLARCTEHIRDKTPDEIRDMVSTGVQNAREQTPGQ